jgi:hypothetical protein
MKIDVCEKCYRRDKLITGAGGDGLCDGYICVPPDFGDCPTEPEEKVFVKISFRSENMHLCWNCVAEYLNSALKIAVKMMHQTMQNEKGQK